MTAIVTRLRAVLLPTTLTETEKLRRRYPRLGWNEPPNTPPPPPSTPPRHVRGEAPVMTDTPIPHFEGSAECAWRNVRMTPELMNALVEAAMGRGYVVDWREPDADGFYTPTVAHADGTPKGWSGPY